MEEKEYGYIYRYSRKQALEDGVLIDITHITRECGFSNLNVACTANAYFDHFLDENHIRSVMKLFYLLIVLHNIEEKDLVTHLDINKEGKEEMLWLHLGPGDEGEAVGTLMYPDDY